MSQLDTLPTPQEMVRHLDRFVRGQARAKRDLALAFHDHYLGLAAAERSDIAGRVSRGRQHVLMLGPTGCGKTLLVRTLCEWLGVPVAFWSATSITESGYVGDDVDEPLKHLLRQTQRDAARAHRGVVVLDEIDKVRAERANHRDVSGEGVQNGLLTLLDGRIAHLRDRQDALGTIDTSKLLFVCMGAFGGVPKIVRNRLRGERVLGFAERAHGRADEPDDDDAYAAATTADLVEYGMLPEFVGRFPNLTAVHSLDEEDLVAMLEEQEGSALERERTMWDLHGIELRVDVEALRAIARRAIGRGTGARGLAFELRRSLRDLAWRRTEFAAGRVQRIVVDPQTLEGAEPTLEHLVRPRREPAATRLRRVAFGRREPTPEEKAMRRDRKRRGEDQQELGVEDGVPAGAIDAAALADVRRATRADDPGAPRKSRVHDRLLYLRIRVIRWGDAPPEARAWWDRFEQEWPIEVVVRAAEELKLLGATVKDLWSAARDTGVLGVDANLRWLAYLRERRAWQNRQHLKPLVEARLRHECRKRGEPPPDTTGRNDVESLPPL